MIRTSQKSIIHLLRQEVVRIEENKYAMEKMVKLSKELLQLIKTSNNSIIAHSKTACDVYAGETENQ